MIKVFLKLKKTMSQQRTRRCELGTVTFLKWSLKGSVREKLKGTQAYREI